MPLSTKYANPQSTIALRERSSSSRQNSVEAYGITSLNTLDDDVNRMETAMGLTADAAPTSSICLNTDTTTNQTGTVSVTADSTTVTGSGTTFAAGDVGKFIRTNGGQIREITAFSGVTSITVDLPFETTEAAVNFKFLQKVNSSKEFVQNIIIPETTDKYPDAVISKRALAALLKRDPIFGCVPEWTNAAAGIIKPGAFIDKDGTSIYSFASELSYSMATNGVNGLNQINLTGTVATTNGATGLTGTSTVFLTELAKGDLVTIGANNYVIASVTNDTAAVLMANAAATVSGQTCTRNSELASTWYYLYLEAKSNGSDVKVLISPRDYFTNAVTPDLHTNYTKWVQLPIALRNDSGSNVLAYLCDFSDHFTDVFWRDVEGAAPFSLLSGGTATTAFSNPGGGTNVDCSGVVPPISRAAHLWAQTTFVTGAVATSYIKDPNSTSTNGLPLASVGSNALYGFITLLQTLNSSQQFAYRLDANTSNLTVIARGYRVTRGLF